MSTLYPLISPPFLPHDPLDECFNYMVRAYRQEYAIDSNSLEAFAQSRLLELPKATRPSLGHGGNLLRSGHRRRHRYDPGSRSSARL